jgi:tRNA (guanine-N7-)-methyltransferase
MARKLKYDIPGPDWRRTPAEVLDGSWEDLFVPDLKGPFSLVVEVGFGRGEFLVDLAERNPDVAFVGVELSFKRVLKLARRMAVGRLRNVRLLQARGEQVVSDLLAPESVQTFWINFPDPWPKNRHAKNRLLQSDFVRELGRRLVPGGTLQIATDDRPYAEQIDEVLASEPSLENAFWPLYWRPEVEGRPVTGFEARWREEGRPLHFFAYRRRGRS